MLTKESVLGFLIGVLLVLAAHTIYRQHQTINELIELNHDKSLYIDSGCRGHYQGAEEWLPGERP